MSELNLRVSPKRLKSCMKSLDDCAGSVMKLSTQLNAVYSDVSADDSGMAEVKQYIHGVVQRLIKDQKTCKLLSMNLGVISGLYENAEKEITGVTNAGTPSRGKGRIAGAKAISTIGSMKKFSEQFAASYGDNFKSDLRNAVMESSGSFMSTMGGFLSYMGASGRSAGSNAFVMVPRSISEKTLRLVRNGQIINSGAKYGVPLIGAVLDYASLKESGQSTVDAGVKSIAHLGIGLAGGQIGAAVGTLVGGPILGTAIGFCAGTAVSTIANMSFDWVYDNHLKPGFKKAVKQFVGSCQASPPSGAVAVSGL